MLSSPMHNETLASSRVDTGLWLRGLRLGLWGVQNFRSGFKDSGQESPGFLVIDCSGACLAGSHTAAELKFFHGFGGLEPLGVWL